MNAAHNTTEEETGIPRAEVGSESRRARRIMERLPGEPFWLCAWKYVVFLHLETNPALLQRVVPFPLDRYNDRAFVSLVAFTLSGMRPRIGGRFSRLLFRPFGTHRFLNVRTYVKHYGEPGIYFLSEYLDAPKLNHLLGPTLCGLPFHAGRLVFDHKRNDERFTGCVEAHDGILRYEARNSRDAATRDDAGRRRFLLERYRAFTERNARRGWFPVWHAPWKTESIEPRITDSALLATTGEWCRSAQLVAAHHSTGPDDVWMGRRQPL